MRLHKQQSNWIRLLSLFQISANHRNQVLATGLMVLFFFGMSSSVSNPQAQKQEEVKKADPIRKPVSLSTGEMEKAMIKAGEEIQKQFIRYDSVLDVQKSNVSQLNSLVNEQKRTNRRLATILQRFNPDSVKKYEMEYIDPEGVKPDTSKKKIDYPQVTPPKPKRSLWKRIFG